MSKRLPGRILATAVKNAFKKPATIAYPNAEASINESYRGRLEYDPTDCIGCSMCMRDCPTGAIRIKNYGTKTERDMHAYLDTGRCVFCCQCVDTCPKNSLSFSNQVFLARLQKEDLEIEL